MIRTGKRGLTALIDSNRALWKALNALTHPIALAALALLLLNDHLLRWSFPSWWTGKLGDAAWLIFAPLLAALPLALLLRSRWTHQPRMVASLAFGAVGVGFALAKTHPAANAAARAAWETLTGWPSGFVVDPTDLLMLPALLIGVWMWRRAEATPAALRRRTPVIVALAAFATIATSPPNFPFGVICLIGEGQQIYAFIGSGYRRTDAYQQRYISHDGGLNWEFDASSNAYSRVDIQRGISTECQNRVLNNPMRVGELLFRFSEQRIERSSDGGATWQLEYDLTVANGEPRIRYLDRTYTVQSGAAPFDAEIAPVSRHLVLAMGLDGVLVRTADGSWIWSQVGEYAYIPFNWITSLPKLLGTEVLIAIVLFLLAPVWMLPGENTTQSCWSSVVEGLTYLSILGWVILVFTPSRRPFDGLIDPTLLAQFMIGIPLFIFAANMFWRRVFGAHRRGILLRMLVSTVTAAVLFGLPYLLWARGTIPNYTFAQLAAVGLTGVVLISESVYLRRLGRKKKHDEDVEWVEVEPEDIDP